MILIVNLECHNTDYISYNTSFVVYFNLSYNQSLIQFLDLSSLKSSVIGTLPYTLLRFRTLVSCSEKNTFWEMEPLPCLSFRVHYEMRGRTTPPPPKSNTQTYDDLTPPHNLLHSGKYLHRTCLNLHVIVR